LKLLDAGERGCHRDGFARPQSRARIETLSAGGQLLYLDASPGLKAGRGLKLHLAECGRALASGLRPASKPGAD